MKTLKRSTLGLVLVTSSFAIGLAQGITGSTSVTIDPSSLMGTASCETDLDSDVQPYYEALVDCKVQDGAGNQVAAGQAIDTYDDQGYALDVLTFTATLGTTYTATGVHRALIYFTDQPEDGGGYTSYDDPNNFESFADQVTQYYPEEHYWQGPGPDIQTRRSELMVGNTYDTADVPQVPTTATIISNTKTTFLNQTETECDSSSSQANAYGYQRCVTYQIGDQSTPSAAISSAFTVHETITVLATNISTINHTGDNASNSAGQFLDELQLIGNSSTAIPSNACIYAKQTFSVSGNTIRTNCLKYSSTDVSITDITSNPNSCPTTCP